MKRFYHALKLLLRAISISDVRRGGWPAGIALCVLCLCWPAAHAQQQYPPPDRPPHMSPGQAPIPSSDNDAMAAKLLLDQAAKRNVQRQQQLVADTDKLLLLAQQLKAEVDKTNKDTLSIAVVKKAAEIEKLAKSVKNKMKAE